MPGATPSYPPQLKRGAVRLVRSSPSRTILQIAKKLSISDNSLRNWVKQSDIGQGEREGLTTDEREELIRLWSSCTEGGGELPRHRVSSKSLSVRNYLASGGFATGECILSADQTPPRSCKVCLLTPARAGPSDNYRDKAAAHSKTLYAILSASLLRPTSTFVRGRELNASAWTAAAYLDD